MRSFILGLILILILAIPMTTQQQNKNMDGIIAKAREFVQALEKGNFEDSVKHFDETMTKLAPPEKMREVWEAIVKQVGRFKGQKGIRTESIPKYDIVYVTCAFERAILDIKVVFNKDEQIAGQFFVPPQSDVEYSPPDYVDKDSFLEKEVKFGVEGWLLPGTLTIPQGDGPFPAVVLVHGSGPNDRDESLGPNKPFRDLAWGLATRNIAVLRYDKRTKVYGQKILANKDTTLTVYEETIEDALSAVNLLRETDKIDATNIFVLGHSLGGALIPRIAALDSRIAGFIVMAGPTRALEDLFVDQMEYISLLDGKLSEEESAKLDGIKETVQKIKQLDPSNPQPPRENLLGAYPEYWLDLKGYKPAEVAKSISCPLIILQGSRDYQVTLEDFEGWKNALDTRKNVVYKLYSDDNHLLIPGKGKCTPQEYFKVGHVDSAVIADLAEWIKKNRE
jgi:fermentation-respiration switch protein FrsA (DUF1100 family)